MTLGAGPKGGTTVTSTHWMGHQKIIPLELLEESSFKFVLFIRYQAPIYIEVPYHHAQNSWSYVAGTCFRRFMDFNDTWWISNYFGRHQQIDFSDPAPLESYSEQLIQRLRTSTTQFQMVQYTVYRPC